MNEQIKEQLENLFYSVSTENGRRLPQSLCEQLAEETMKITGALSRSGGVWVKASERLPEKPGCYFVRWLEDGRVIIKGANMWELLPGEKFFDVSDDDDEDRTNPRSIQPHEWLDESPAADKGDAIEFAEWKEKYLWWADIENWETKEKFDSIRWSNNSTNPQYLTTQQLYELFHQSKSIKK